MISVIIPTYNASAYIGEAIDSVLRQTRTDYEILVVDDGSTDGTCDMVARRYPQVRCLPIEHGGVSRARNHGIARACGDYIAFLDADDRWLPQKLEKQVALMESDPRAGLVFTENFFFDRHGISSFSVNKRSRLMRGNVVRNIFLHSYVVTSTVMVRRSVFGTVGVFDEDLAVAEDDNLWMRIGLRYRILLVDERLVLYRMTAGSLSSDFAGIVAGVTRQIELLNTRYPELYAELGGLAIRRKYADLYFSQGYRDFNRNDYKSSRTRFIDSYLNYPLRLRSLFYYLSTYLPEQTIDALRSLKRREGGAA